jgi:hypothetical protein
MRRDTVVIDYNRIEENRIEEDHGFLLSSTPLDMEYETTSVEI